MEVVPCSEVESEPEDDDVTVENTKRNRSQTNVKRHLLLQDIRRKLQMFSKAGYSLDELKLPDHILHELDVSDGCNTSDECEAHSICSDDASVSEEASDVGASKENAKHVIFSDTVTVQWIRNPKIVR